ncbi:MAG: hypothetical protein K6E30_00825 [Lachnospiraceae bacterium]|nr:hypothetical protein [Lachnospiraceae bacterium]
MKKLFVCILCALLAVSACACGSNENTQIANPFKDYETMEEAEKAAGFDMTVPETLDGREMTLIQVMNDEMIQVFYGEDENRVLVRKAEGNEDISGDYTEYGETETVDVNGAKVTMKGDEGQVKAAVWTAGKYTYAVDADQPVSRDTMAEWISGIA